MENRYSKRKVKAKEIEQQAIQLRKEGYAYQEIGDKLGCNRETARKAVKNAFNKLTEEIKESTEELRQLQLDRMEAYLTALAPQIQLGDTKAIQTALKVIAETNKLLGLYIPVKQQVEVNTNDNWREQITAMIHEQEQAKGLNNG